LLLLLCSRRHWRSLLACITGLQLKKHAWCLLLLLLLLLFAAAAVVLQLAS
jgi:hypothetical protein